jgi:hypothetical protein
MFCNINMFSLCKVSSSIIRNLECVTDVRKAQYKRHYFCEDQ